MILCHERNLYIEVQIACFQSRFEARSRRLAQSHAEGRRRGRPRVYR